MFSLSFSLVGWKIGRNFWGAIHLASQVKLTGQREVYAVEERIVRTSRPLYVFFFAEWKIYQKVPSRTRGEKT